MALGLLAWGGVVVAVVLVAFLVAFYSRWAWRTKQRTGQFGVRQTSRIVCPKCHAPFDYDWVPGASFSAVRLGSRRYMACQVCGRWSTFDVRAGLIPPAP